MWRPASGRNAQCQHGPDHRAGRGNGKPPFRKALQELFSSWVSSKEACEQFLASIRFGERKQRATGTGKAAERRAYGSVRADRRWQGRVVRDPVPSDIERVGGRRGLQGREFSTDSRASAEGVRPPDRRTRSVQIGYADSQTFNPLDFIDKDSPTAIDECRDLAEALVIRTGQEKDPHWVDSAEAWISALTALVVHYGEPNDRSLQTVRTLLSESRKT